MESSILWHDDFRIFVGVFEKWGEEVKGEKLHDKGSVDKTLSKRSSSIREIAWNYLLHFTF